jgi:hypothetical protein
MSSQKTLKIFILCILMTFAAGCAGTPIKFGGTHPNFDNTNVDFSKGKEIVSTASGFQLLLFIPININSRHEQALQQLMGMAGRDYITDIKIEESWVYAFVGTVYTTTIKATAYPRKVSDSGYIQQTTSLKKMDEQPLKPGEQTPGTVTPGIKTGAPKQPVPQLESGQEIAYVPKESIPERKVISLRSKPDENFSLSHYQALLRQYNFFDNTLNKYGSFQNDFVDNRDGTITDRATGIMWQKSGSSRDLYLIETEDYIKILNRDRFAGYSDWRIPTTDEIVSLMKQTKKSWRDLYIDPLFDKKQYSCWSSDVGILNISAGHYNAWSVNFEEGTAQQIMTRNSVQSGTGASQNPDWRSFSKYIRAVRSLQQSNP